jgi:hypothetical protein
MTTREQILEKIQTDLKATGYFRDVYNRHPGIPDIESATFPCVFVYSGPESRVKDNRGAIGSETWEWHVVLEVWGREVEMESFLGYIHHALFNDYSLGNLVVLAERAGVDMWVLDPERDWCSMVVPYSILYRHILGVM